MSCRTERVSATHAQILHRISIDAIQRFAFFKYDWEIPESKVGTFLTAADLELHKLSRWSKQEKVWTCCLYVGWLLLASKDSLKSMFQNLGGEAKARLVAFCRRYGAAEAEEQARDIVLTTAFMSLQVCFVCVFQQGLEP